MHKTGRGMLAAASFAAAAMATTGLADGTPPAPVYSTLSATRANITLPVYTPDQKQLVAEQAQIFLRDLYVNRERKIQLHGAGVDPVPGVAEVVANARTMSEEALHEALEALFTRQHDLHLNYYYPVPFACYRNLLPFSVAQVVNPTGKAVVAVTGLAKIPNLTALSADAGRIAVGDTLTSFDGLDPLLAAATLADVGGGSNQYALVRRELEVLTYRSQLLHKLPVNDQVHLTFQTREGDTYALDLPWITKADQSCLNPSNKAKNVPHHKAPRYLGVDDFQKEYNEAYGLEPTLYAGQALNDGADPIIHYDTLQNEYGTFGYLRLDSFEPTKLSPAETVAAVEKLLTETFAQTDGLIIDVRGNGGGDISLAEDLAQLMTPSNITPEGFRLLNSQVNRDLFAAIPDWDDSFRQALHVAQVTGAEFTQPVSLTSTDSANRIGQVYFKPIALFANSSCYSACDMFAATLQDHGIATIWGEDGNTGGGGANVVEQTYFINALTAGKTAPFAALPGGQGMRVAWRQTIRSGTHEGQLLEEAGVTADKLAPLALSDLFDTDSEQYRIISADLAKQASSYKAWVKLANTGRVDLHADGALAFQATVSDTQAIEMRRDGVSLGYQEVAAPASAAGAPVAITLPAGTVPAPAGMFEFIGYSEGDRVWRAMQAYRVVPAPTLLADGVKLPIDIANGKTDPFAFYTTGADAKQGWTLQNGKLKVGLGDSYPDELHAEASLFLDLTQRTALTLTFDYEGKTEQDYDFFKVEIYVDGVKSDLIAPASGDLGSKHVSFDLKPYLGNVVEVRFTFDSDEGVHATGVSLSNVTLD